MLPDVEVFAEHVVATIKSALSPVVARVAALEKREPLNGRDGLPGSSGLNGRDADMSFVAELKAQLATLHLEVASLRTEREKAATVRTTDVAAIVSAEVAKAISALPVPQDGKDGRSVTVEDVAPLIVAETRKAVADWPVPKDGEPGASVDPAVVEAMVKQHVEMTVAAIPLPKDGRDGRDGTGVSLSDLHDTIVGEVQKAVTALPPPKDGAPGASVDPAVVDTLVAKHVAAIPLPKDGRSLTVDDVAPLIASEVTKAVRALPVPKDGIGVMGALIGRDGHLVLTLSDGATKDLGLIVGRDADADEIVRQITEAVATLPLPKDGAPGRDGNLEHLKAVYDGERTVTLCFKNGDPIDGGVIRLPVVIDRGVFKAEKSYEPGDGVTWGGSWWIAQKATSARPGEASEDSRAWRLAVKKGADGKPGPPGPQGDPGKPGPQGPQGRQGY